MLDVIEVYFPNWEKYLPLLDLEGEDKSYSTATNNGRQITLSTQPLHPLYAEYLKDVIPFVNNVLKERGIDVKIESSIAGWYIIYDENGYQDLHTHSHITTILSAILCFDTIDWPVFTCAGKNYYDKAGYLRIFDSRLEHGALIAGTQRRIIVQDFRVAFL